MDTRHRGQVHRVLALGLPALVAALGCGDGTPLPREDPSKLTIRLTSAAFKEGGMIPRQYTCDGDDKSPPLEWTGVPTSARSLVLICDDPDAPMGVWSHWVVHGLSPDTTSLPEGVSPSSGPLASSQGKNDFGKIGYGGPCPPGGTHHYFFRLYALDVKLTLDSPATRSTVLKAMEGHIVAEGRLMGTYSR